MNNLDQKHLEELLTKYKNGEIAMEVVLERLKDLPFEDLGFAKVDHHRAIRKGFPEVVYCPGKTIDQIQGIFKSLIEKNKNILLTRASDEIYQSLKKLESGLLLKKNKYQQNFG